MAIAIRNTVHDWIQKAVQAGSRRPISSLPAAGHRITLRWTRPGFRSTTSRRGPPSPSIRQRVTSSTPAVFRVNDRLAAAISPRGTPETPRRRRAHRRRRSATTVSCAPSPQATIPARNAWRSERHRTHLFIYKTKNILALEYFQSRRFDNGRNRLLARRASVIRVPIHEGPSSTEHTREEHPSGPMWLRHSPRNRVRHARPRANRSRPRSTWRTSRDSTTGGRSSTTAT